MTKRVLLGSLLLYSSLFAAQTYERCCWQPIEIAPFVFCLTGPAGSEWNRQVGRPSCALGFGPEPDAWRLMSRTCTLLPWIPTERELAVMYCSEWTTGPIIATCWSPEVYYDCRPSFDYDGDDDVDLEDFAVYQREFVNH